MKESDQDRHYLDVEADAFFERNHGNADPQILRPGKRAIADIIASCTIKPKRVLEYGCNYGDLLNHYANEGAECHGVEPSGRAVAFGRKAYGDGIELNQGTLARNPINDDERFLGYFDLVVVEDVFCWVSRETLFQSVAHIDNVLAEGGHLFIREFLPLSNRRNRNHHADGEDVFCFKPAASHARIFTASGLYATTWQKIWMDQADGWVTSSDRSPFESRWSDSLLRKSFHDYYAE